MLTETCSVCSTAFAVQFRYQTEEVVDRDEAGRERVRFARYCSQACLERSHRAGDGSVGCHACGTAFVVELAAQVVFVRGQRRYACGPDCRGALLGETDVRRGAAPAGTRSPLADGAHVTHDSEPPPVLDPRRAGPPRGPAPGAARARVIAVFNHKGGTGKTTTAVTLAAGLAARGERVLLVDTDGQGNVAVSLGLGSEPSLYHVLVMGLAHTAAVHRSRAGFDVLPSNETLAAAELYLAGRKQRDRVLASRLAATRDHYDFVLVDCSPSLSLLNQNALCFADAVLCPVACDYLSLVGVRQVLRTLKNVNRLLDHPVELWGVLPTMFDGRARICHEALDTLREHFGERCLPPIRAAIRVKEAPAKGLTLQEHAPGSSAALDYALTLDRLIAHRRGGDAAPSAVASPATAPRGAA